ncbi:hydrogenase maturation protease [bacterium]|nr:hydrogenase maturation protease [bacterium]MBU1064771.1 hydrogenase maturation protease [bacterium]MBU1633232.1 hydrogenase maturation protease [bacterium]MBU1874179.1 hydrogenase maturation protease [bacterium]
MNFKEFQKKLGPIINKKIVMVGLGNPMRRDDQSGLVLLEEIQKRKLLSGANFVFANTTPENHLEKIVSLQPEIVIFVDTVKMQQSPGTIEEILSNQVETKGFSTHSYSIKLVENYLRLEGIGQFMYIGIEPGDMGMGEFLTTPVKEGIESFFN